MSFTKLKLGIYPTLPTGPLLPSGKLRVWTPVGPLSKCGMAEGLTVQVSGTWVPQGGRVAYSLPEPKRPNCDEPKVKL